MKMFYNSVRFDMKQDNGCLMRFNVYFKKGKSIPHKGRVCMLYPDMDILNMWDIELNEYGEDYLNFVHSLWVDKHSWADDGADIDGLYKLAEDAYMEVFGHGSCFIIR